MLLGVAILLGAWTWPREPLRKPVTLVLLSLQTVVTLAALLGGRLVGLRFSGRGWRWFGGLLLSFACAAGFLAAGARGGVAAPWGHGVWHLCCAAGMYCYGQFLAEEGRTGVDELSTVPSTAA